MIVGIGHQAQRGKDTAGNALVRELGFEKGAFADRLKELAVAIDPIIDGEGPMNVQIGRGRLSNIVNREGWEMAKMHYPEVRRFLQALGVAVRSVIGADTWVDLVLEGHTDDDDLVITDVRFRNEAEAIKARGGQVVKIDRRLPHQIVGYTHESETELADWEFDHVFDNNGTVVDLENAVVGWVKALRTPPAKKAEVAK